MRANVKQMNGASGEMPLLPSLVGFSPDDVRDYFACGAWMPATAGDVLRSVAASSPDNVALVDEDTRVSYWEYNARSERLAAGLLRMGLRPGDRALFQMATVSDTAIALFACFKAGVIPVCTLPQHRAVEIEIIGGLTQPRAYFVQADAAATFDLVTFACEMASRLPSVEHVLVARGGSLPSSVRRFEDVIDAESNESMRLLLGGVTIRTTDVMVLQISGGTTGMPKVMPRFHAEYLGYCAAWAGRLSLTPDDVHLWALPIIHNASMIYHLIPAVLGGRTLCLMSRFDVEQFFRVIERERVSVTGSIGPIASAILDYSGLDKFDLSRLKAFTTLARGDAIEAHLGRTAITVYGISEGLLMGSTRDAPAQARHRTVGQPVSPHDEIKLLAEDGVHEVAFGQIGELAFKGPSSIRGYYGLNVSSAQSFTADGFFRTGDLMRARAIEGETYYSFEGRLKDNIDRGGEKFGTEDIENLIARHKAIADVKVVAMPDRKYGEKPCAFVILRPASSCPSVDEMASFLLGFGLAKFKIPERIELIDQFPVTQVGKVDKAALRKRIAELVDREIKFSKQSIA